MTDDTKDNDVVAVLADDGTLTEAELMLGKVIVAIHDTLRKSGADIPTCVEALCSALATGIGLAHPDHPCRELEYYMHMVHANIHMNFGPKEGTVH